jgi:Flp pilus assembly protein TadB
MSYQDDERERLRRLRDRQLQARNPQRADARVMRQVAKRRGRRQRKVTPADMVRELPYKWRGLFLGVIIGMFIWLLLYALVEGAWVDLVGLASIVVLAFLGFALGQAFDVRDELKRL